MYSVRTLSKKLWQLELDFFVVIWNSVKGGFSGFVADVLRSRLHGKQGLLLGFLYLILFVPLRGEWKACLIAVPFISAIVDEGSGWLVRFASPHFAVFKVVGFVGLQASLATLIGVSLWSVFTSSQAENYVGPEAFDEEELDG